MIVIQQIGNTNDEASSQEKHLTPGRFINDGMIYGEPRADDLLEYYIIFLLNNWHGKSPAPL